jgi:hypothetical protein
VETRLKGYKYFEIERDFFNKLGVLIDGDFKFGVLPGINSDSSEVN